MSVKIGIIGGSGLSDPLRVGSIDKLGLSDDNIIQNRQERELNTPFGKPSDALILGTIEGVECVLLSRYGRGQVINPTNVNYRANVWAMKQLGCTHLLATDDCGSLQEDIHAGDIVVLDQFIDRTQKRNQTFYDGSRGCPPGICHMPMAEPFCPKTSKLFYDCATELGYSASPTGTIMTIEGPRFSSKAESKLFKSWGAHVVNMTTVPEVVLAKEAGLCYAALAIVADYDSWRDDVSVDVEDVRKTVTVMDNSKRTQNLLLKVLPRIAADDWDDTMKRNREMVTGNTLLPHRY